MSSERHTWNEDPAMDAYVHHYRNWFRTVAIDKSLRIGKVLDIACGNGSCMSHWLAERGAEVVLGVDVHDGPWQEHPHVIYYRQDAVSFVAPKQFDLITSFEFIEHIPHYELLKFLRNMNASLIDGGYFIGTTPNGPSGPNVFKTDNPYHVREWHEGELRNVLSHFFSECSVSDIGLNMTGFVCRK